MVDVDDAYSVFKSDGLFCPILEVRTITTDVVLSKNVKKKTKKINQNQESYRAGYIKKKQ